MPSVQRKVRGAINVLRILGGRARLRLGRPYRQVRFRSRGVECNICGSRFSDFSATAMPPFKICLGCGSHARHRYMFLWLDRHAEVVRPDMAILHLAPEAPLARRMRATGARYVSADIAMDDADVHADIAALPFADRSFDLVICSHVLEHVNDDAAALAELRRVLAPPGRLLVMFPIDESRATTYEDSTIVTPEAREIAFWQDDHVRLYGRDAAAQLASAGFEVTSTRTKEEISLELIERHDLLPEEQLFVLTPA